MKPNDSSEFETSDTEVEQHTDRPAQQAADPPSQSHDSPRTVQIPSLLTNSLRVVLSEFGEQIIQLSAKGSVETTNSSFIDTLREYGLSWENTDKQRLNLDYEQLPGADPGEPVNPISADARENLLSEVAARLGPTEAGIKPDLAVSSVTIRVSEQDLQAVSPAHTSEFDIRLSSDPAEPGIREPTKRRNVERGLYEQLGFTIRNLNVRSVTETAAKHHEQSDGRYLSWGGPGDTRPRSPTRLAVRINDLILPDEYGVLKPYIVSEDDTLTLDEDALEQVNDRTVGIRNTAHTETGRGN